MNRLQLRRKSVNVRVSTRLAAVLAVLAAAVTLPLVLGAIGGAAPPPVPLVKVLADPFEDGLGYHGSAEEPSIFAARNPARAGGLADSSTIVATEQVGRIYDGGASDIGYQVSVDGGKSWKHGELPLTMQGGVSDTCAGQLNRASDTVTVYDQKHTSARRTSTGARRSASTSRSRLPTRRTRTGSPATTGRRARATATATSNTTTTETATGS